MLSFRCRVAHIAAFIQLVLQQTNGTSPAVGTIRLWREGLPSGRLTSFGRVQIFGTSGNWGNICGNVITRLNRLTEAHVICHQLGYRQASSVGTGETDGFGTDSFEILYDGVSCDSANYLTISQCRIMGRITSDCFNGEDDLSVICVDTWIWQDPYDGMVRLQEGMYSNQGFVEVYCNREWGTFCSGSFTKDVASTVCRQLGYARSETTLIPGHNRRPTWLTELECDSSEVCISSCEMCPNSTQQCFQSDIVVRLTCGIDLGAFLTVTNMTCLPDDIIISPTVSPDSEQSDVVSLVTALVIAMLVIGVAVLVAIVVAVSFLAVLRWKHHQNRNPVQQEATYESVLELPPLPPPRVQDCVAYFRVEMSKNEAYSSGLNKSFDLQVEESSNGTYESIDGARDDTHLQVSVQTSKPRSLSETLPRNNFYGIVTKVASSASV